MTEQEAAQAEAERRYPIEYRTERDEIDGVNPIPCPSREGFIEGAEWERARLSSCVVEAAPSDINDVLAMLDDLNVNESGGIDYDAYSRLHDAVSRVSQPVQVEVTDEMVERSARAGHEYLRALRPEDHGPYASWDELDEGYREYLRGIQRAALAALGGGE